MKNKNRLLTNGFLIGGIAIFIAVIFSVKTGWGVAQVIIILMMTVSSATQFIIYFKFFKNH